MSNSIRLLTASASAAALLFTGGLLTGCGGGSGSDSGTGAAAASTTLSGVAAKGPLKGALVTAYAVSASGVVGSAELAHATTASDAAAGAYSLSLGSYSGNVQLVVTAPAGATTADEASGLDVPLPASFVLHANTVVAAPTGAQTQSASITPYTELAHSVATASGGITAANIAAANAVVFALIGLDPVATTPLASNAVPSATATDAQKRYALLNAAVSKLASSTPKTDDTATLACFAAAGNALGAKLQCAVQQVAASVSVTGAGTQAVAVPNKKLVGLADALVAVAADTTINKTGATLGSSDSTVKAIGTAETTASSDGSTPIGGGTTTPNGTDVATAKAFFAGLRANAAALRSGAADAGVTEAVKAFGDSVRGESSAVTNDTVQVIELARVARDLWESYTAGGALSNNSAPTAFGGCTVYQSAFPTQFGPAGAPLGTPYVSSSVPATAPSNATWVGCSVNSSPIQNDGLRRYRQTLLIDFAADPTLAVVPYLAATRAIYFDNGANTLENLTPTLSGTARFTGATEDPLRTASLVGDLPPAVDGFGNLLAERYAVDVAATVTKQSDGTDKLSFSSGKFGVVPVGATTVGLSVDISPGGASYAVIPTTDQDPVQSAARKVQLVATISDANGTLTGTLLVDRFSSRADDSPWDPTHATFTGDLSVVPTTGTAVAFFNGTLEASNDTTPVFGFTGTLKVPNRPVATLTASVTETATSAYAFNGRYVQNGLVVTITGSRAGAVTAATVAESSGVSFSYRHDPSGTAPSNVTVGGRQAAVIDWGAKTVTYGDGTFESIF